ncbi:hemicentin-1-like [Branchiostoma lanceolatum]|uniref:hemicentin-1-like n=1 Tax=Branchiostoma lanceolatum TaxID=7740 RepID=UPI003452CBEB
MSFESQPNRPSFFNQGAYGTVTVTVTPPADPVLTGQTTVIGCSYTASALGSRTNVEWFRDPAGTDELIVDHEVGWDTFYYGNQVGRLDIVDDASVRISDTRLGDGGVYRCTVSVRGVGSDSGDVTVNAQALPSSPTITISSSTPSTLAPVTLTGRTTGAFPVSTISWYRGDEDKTGEAAAQQDTQESDGTFTSTRTLTFTPTKADNGATYRCVVTHGALQGDRQSTTTLDVRYPAEISAAPPMTTSVIAGQSATLNCTTDGNPASYTYTWKEGNREINHSAEDQYSTTGGVLTISSVRRDQHSTQYSCEVTNNIGSPDTASTTLNVQHGPDVSSPPTITVTEGGDLTVTCQVTANPAASSVGWTKQGNSTAVSNSGTLSITNIQRGEAGTYVCTAQNTFHDGSTETGTANTEVVVQYAPSKPTITVDPTPVVEDQTVTLTCSSDSAVPDPTYSWKFTAQGQAEQDVSFGTTANNGGTLTITNVSRAQAGQYRCTATNVVGETDSELIEMVVNFPPEGMSITTHPKEVEFGDDVTLNCSVKAANPAVEDYSWTKSAGALPAGARGETTNQLQIANLTRQDSGRYKYLDQPTITSNLGGSGQTFHTTTEGQSLSLECTAQAYPNATVVWTRPDGTTQEGSVLDLGLVNRTEAGTYNCTASNIIKGAQWFKHSGLVVIINYPPSVNTFTADPNPADENTPVTLNCTVDSNPASNSISIVRVGTGSAGDVTLATGQGRTLSHTMQDMIYTDTGTYRCQAENGIGDAATQTLELVVNYAPVFVEVRDKYAVAKGDPVSMTCNVTAYPTHVTFIWSKDGGTVAENATTYVTNIGLSNTLSYTAVTETDYGFYNCTATNNKGSRSKTIELAAESSPEPSSDLKVTMKNSSRYVTVQWTARFNGGRNTEHTVQYRTGGGEWQDGTRETEPANENRSQYTVTFQLTEKATYDIRVMAANGIEPAAVSNVVSVTIEGLLAQCF